MRKPRFSRLEIGRRTLGEDGGSRSVEQLFKMARRLRQRPKAAFAVDLVKELSQIEAVGVHHDALHQIADEDHLIFKAIPFLQLGLFLVQYLEQRGPDIAAARQCDIIYHCVPSIIINCEYNFRIIS
ncbi:hypothetical protein SDC9_141034 [bioreactor metagenome]|uniref:Uncharacterized protein n=1 Tax=bioreactor metagenome TaxID=1076179 RepID=A0A645DZY1_9ZZZZ